MLNTLLLEKSLRVPVVVRGRELERDQVRNLLQWCLQKGQVPSSVVYWFSALDPFESVPVSQGRA